MSDEFIYQLTRIGTAATCSKVPNAMRYMVNVFPIPVFCTIIILSL